MSPARTPILLSKLATALRGPQSARTRWQRFINLRIKYLLFLFFKRVLRSKKPIAVRTRLFFGARFRTLNLNEPVWFYGVNPDDAGMIRFMIDRLKPGDIFLDVGAHHGFYAMLASELVGPRGAVHAFEPATLHYRLLAANAAGRGNVLARRLAVGDRAGEAEFYEHDKESSALDPFLPGHDERSVAKRFRRVRVGTTTLDEYCTEQRIIPSVIKIDVEGGESAVISGACRILTDYAPVIIMEVWRKAPGNKNHVRAIRELARLGYRPFVLNEDGSASPHEDVDPERDIPESDVAANFVWLK